MADRGLGITDVYFCALRVGWRFSLGGPLVGTVSERIKITGLKEGEEPSVHFEISSEQGDGPEEAVGPGWLRLSEFVERFGEEMGKKEPGAEEVKLAGTALTYLRQAGKIKDRCHGQYDRAGRASGVYRRVDRGGSRSDRRREAAAGPNQEGPGCSEIASHAGSEHGRRVHGRPISAQRGRGD